MKMRKNSYFTTLDWPKIVSYFPWIVTSKEWTYDPVADSINERGSSEFVYRTEPLPTIIPTPVPTASEYLVGRIITQEPSIHDIHLNISGTGTFPTGNPDRSSIDYLDRSGVNLDGSPVYSRQDLCKQCVNTGGDCQNVC